MAKDFRTNQIRAVKIIGSGGIDPDKPYLGLLIYSSSDASNYDGGLESAFNTHVTNNIGNDVWMAVGGTRSTTGVTRADGSSVLFVGDVVVSGTLWAERSIIEVDNSVAGNFIAPNKAILGVNQNASSNKISNGWARALIDPTTPNDSVADGDHRAGTISFNLVQGNNGVYQYDTQFPGTNRDVFFHVSGSRGVRGTNDRGIALFDGDLHTSGNFSMSPASVWTTDIILDNSTDDPPILAQQNGFGNRWTTLEVEQTSNGQTNVVLANSGSQWFGNPNFPSGKDGIKFKVAAGHVQTAPGTPLPLVRPGESHFVISGSGNIAIDPTRALFLDSKSWTYLSSTPDQLDDAGEAAGAVNLSSDPNTTVSSTRSFRIYNMTLSGSNGIFLPNHDGPRWGQTLGIMLAGSLTGGGVGGGYFPGDPGDAGVFYNSDGKVNPHLGGPADSLVVTASAPGHKVNIGAARTDIWGIEDGVNIHASDPSRTDPHGSKIFLYATGSGIEMHGNVTMWNNLTVWGDKIIGHVITASVGDPLLLLNSGALPDGSPPLNMNPSGGGIAIASGSSFNNQAMVFGRYVGSGGPSDRDVFFAGRKDVEDGLVVNLAGSEPIRMLGAGYRFGAGQQHIITASNQRMVFSSSQFAFETGRGLFFNDIGGTVGMGTGAVFLKYNNGINPGPTDLHVGVGSGSIVVTADAGEPTFLYLGGGDPNSGTWLAQGAPAASNGGGTQLFSHANLMISSSGGLALSSSRDIIISASYNPDTKSGPWANGNVKVYGGSIMLSGTNTAGQDQGIIAKAPLIDIWGTQPNSRIWLSTSGEQGVMDGSPTSVHISGSEAGVPGVVYVNVRADQLGADYLTDWKPQGGGPARPDEAGQGDKGTWSGADRFTDVNFMVSGSMNSINTTTRGTALFMGDLKVSGSADFGAITLNNLWLKSTLANQPYVWFSTEDFRIFRDTSGTPQLSFQDPVAGGPLSLTRLAQLSVVDNSDVFAVTPGNGGNSYKSRVLTTGSFSFHHDDGWEPGDVLNASGSADIGSDVFMWISGSIGGKSAGNFGTLAIGGDLVTSGAMYFEEMSTDITSGLTIGADSVAVYAKDVSGETRLFYRNDVMESPIGAGGSLDDAYNQPDGGGAPIAGAGAIITVDDQPVQFQADPGAQGQIVLAITGSVDIWGTADDDTNAVPPVVSFPSGFGGLIRATNAGSDLSLGNNSSTRGQASVIKLTGGDGNVQILPHATEGKLAFASETYQYIRTTNASSALEIYNIQSGGEIQLYAGAASPNHGTVNVRGNVIPTEHDEFDLGSNAVRWANVYTGDLHLRNERGDWTIVEERDYLCVVNNITGKKYKMALEPIEDDE